MWMRVTPATWINQIQSMACSTPVYIFTIEVVFLHLAFQANPQTNPMCFFDDFDCPWLFLFERFWESSIQQTKLLIAIEERRMWCSCNNIGLYCYSFWLQLWTPFAWSYWLRKRRNVWRYRRKRLYNFQFSNSFLILTC